MDKIDLFRIVCSSKDKLTRACLFFDIISHRCHDILYPFLCVAKTGMKKEAKKKVCMLKERRKDYEAVAEGALTSS